MIFKIFKHKKIAVYTFLPLLVFLIFYISLSQETEGTINKDFLKKCNETITIQDGNLTFFKKFTCVYKKTKSNKIMSGLCINLDTNESGDVCKKAIIYEKQPYKNCPPHSYLTNNDTCFCNKGFSLFEKKCINNEIFDDQCKKTHGEKSWYSDQGDRCQCNYGYALFEDQCTPLEKTSKNILDATWEKSGLKFDYPEKLKVKEINGVDFIGFLPDFEWGDNNIKIGVSKINVTDVLNKCAKRRQNYFLEPENDKIINAFNELKNNGVNDQNRKILKDLETYNCHSAGSNEVISPFSVSGKNGAIFHKSVGDSDFSICKINTQVLIHSNDDEFYQIVFNYLFGNFEEYCKDYFARRIGFTSDNRWSGQELDKIFKNNQYIYSGEYKLLSFNKLIIDQIIKSIEIMDESM